MNCDQVNKQIPDFLAGELEEKSLAELQAHLTGCERCRAEAESLQKLWTQLGTLPGETPGATLRVRFYAMLDAYKLGMEKVPATRRWHVALDGWLARWWPKRPVVQLGIAVLFLAAGVFAGSRLFSENHPSQDLATVREEMHNLRQMVTLSLLKQESPSERLRGVSWSYQMDQPDTQVLSALLNTLNHDPNVNVRLAAVDALYLFSDQTTVRQELAQSLVQQNSPLVQIALINLIVSIREKKALEALKLLIQNEKINQSVKQRAEWGIRELS